MDSNLDCSALNASIEAYSAAAASLNSDSTLALKLFNISLTLYKRPSSAKT